jgi:hypothetical protein
VARRTQVGELAQPTLRPSASPVDSFARSNAGQGLSQIADALGDLAPSLQRLAQQQIEEERERGKADATTIYADIQAAGQKIKSGEIAPHQSKWYQAAAREQVGRLMASAYGQDLQLATQTDEVLSESTDPEDFDGFETKFRQQWLEEKADTGDRAFSAGFNTTSAQGILNARQGFIADAANRLDGKILDNTYTEHQVSIRDGITAGLTPEQIAKELHERNNALYTVNPKLGKALSRTTIEAVFDAARAFEDPELLKVLDNIQGGAPGSTLGQTREAMSKRDEVEREIRSNRQNRLAAEEKDEKRDRQKRVGEVYDVAFAALEKDPEVDVSQFATAMLGVDRSEVPKLYRIAKAFATAANVDDRGVRNGLWQQAIDSELSRDDVSTAFAEGTITIQTMKQLLSQIRSNESGKGRTTKTSIQHPDYQKAESDLREMWIGQFGDTKGARLVYARQEMQIEWIKYLQTPEGAQAGEEERALWLNKAVFRNFMRTAEPGSASLEEAGKAPKPPMAGITRPSLPDWKTEDALPPGQYGVESFAAEIERVRADNQSELSAQAQALITRFELSGAEIDDFIRSQRLLRSLRPRR